jgi:MurNAc alpha-1-phosphate uridylyltransferase
VIAVETGMVLAAGLGTRLRPITDEKPKALVTVQGRTLVDRALDHLESVDVKRAVVNTHHKAEMVVRHLAGRKTPAITISHEPVLLDTGGGIANALPHLGEPFFVVNGDAVWLNGRVPALMRLAEVFDPGRHDCALLMQETVPAVGYAGRGDFSLDQLGVPQRRGETEVVPFLFAGIQLLSHRLFAGEPVAPFSMNRLWDKAIAQGRIIALVHDGTWYDVGTVAGLAATESRLGELWFPR